MSELRLNFYDFVVKVQTSCDEVLDLLKKDFSFFVETRHVAHNLSIDATIIDSIEDKVPSGLISIKQNARAITYQDGKLRYNYFYGKAVSIIDYTTNTIEVFAVDRAILHEILYLAILSRETKLHDTQGIHKLHAFGVSKGETALLGMMNMKGGKTTLFSYFLDEPGYDLISDDTPLINTFGDVLAFPIRIGFELNSYTQEKLKTYKNKSYRFEREEYGPKDLIDIQEFSNRVSSKKKRVVLFQGVRRHGAGHAQVVKITRYKMARYLLKNMVVGVGLPMVLEYYLEASFKDKIRNAKILLKRGFAAACLLTKSHCFEIHMGNEPEKNFLAVKGLLDSYEQ
ncbi:MAG: hypothetical protein KC478_07660 [Bacteriovoracaceae bacterium]|nr:hypothetical protein [Bacteriovoracaceae bacterium]